MSHFCWFDRVCWGQWLFDWQTMITGVLAIMAAGWAAYLARGQLSAARAQIALQREHEDRARSGRLRVARSTLPSTLSAVCRYAQDAATTLRGLHEHYEIWAKLPNRDGFDAVPVETLPTAVAAAITGILEFASDDVAERIESILREAQVLDSRTAAVIVDDGVNAPYIESMILQATSIYARAESLFGYARNQLPTVDDTVPLAERARLALNRFGFHSPRWDRLKEAAQRDVDNGTPPGEADETDEA